ncbi:hypothetical protein CRYUN_Cryun15aG0135100 [Craigia yunnanensis]
MAAGESSFQLILGSSSMIWQRILAEMGYEFTIMTADIDEKSIRKEKPEELVMALAEAKADPIMSRLQNTGMLEKDAHTTLLITADTEKEDLITNSASQKAVAVLFYQLFARYDAYSSTCLFSL